MRQTSDKGGSSNILIQQVCVPAETPTYDPHRRANVPSVLMNLGAKRLNTCLPVEGRFSRIHAHPPLAAKRVVDIYAQMHFYDYLSGCLQFF